MPRSTDSLESAMVCPWVFSPSTGAKPCSSAAHSLRKTTLFCLFLCDSYYLGIGLCSIPTFGAVLTFPWSYTPSITPENDMTSLGLSTPISPSTSRLPIRLTVPSYYRIFRRFLRAFVCIHHGHPHPCLPLLPQTDLESSLSPALETI